VKGPEPSTVVELAGFGLLDWAAFHWGIRPGLISTGASLLLVGYAVEDNTAVVTIRRMTEPLRRARARHAIKRRERQNKRDRRRKEQASRWRRQPAEIALTVKTD
jgi:hypothetical protein